MGKRNKKNELTGLDELTNDDTGSDDEAGTDDVAMDFGEPVAQEGEGEKSDEAKSDEAKGEEIPTLSPKGASDVSNPNVTALGGEATSASDEDASTVDEAKGITVEPAKAAPSDEKASEPIPDAPKADEDGEGKQPDLSEAHDEAKPVVEAAPEVMDLLKEAANIASPALKKLEQCKEAIEKLENEAKARFDHARQKWTEAVAALEAIFKRG